MAVSVPFGDMRGVPLASSTCKLQPATAPTAGVGIETFKREMSAAETAGNMVTAKGLLVASMLLLAGLETEKE
jgi:hypothetical protein